jgi:NAD(P)-dependent dehydrogenase (short-subunit alcohol dehydrogenase family)
MTTKARAPRFGAESTTEEVLEGIDLTGRRVLITGTSAGLGVETARALAAHGATVIGTARNLPKAREATALVSGAFELVELDLASLASVRRCTDTLLAIGEPVDVIICNAGVMTTPFGRTEDGFETQFGVNHLGHFLLVNRLSSLIRPGGRVVMVASSGHRFSDVDLADPNYQHTPYEELEAYGRAKTANILFAVEFDRRNRDRAIRATALHPGGIHTELGRYTTAEVGARMMKPVKALIASGALKMKWKTLEQGAATSIWAAVVAEADDVGGRYCEDCRVATVEDEGHAALGGVRSYALDPQRAKALWARSEQMIGETF